MIADLWSPLLGVSRISATNDFFSLGGDSLQAMRFTLRAAAAGMTVTLAQVADAPTLSALAEMIDREQGTPQRDGAAASEL